MKRAVWEQVAVRRTTIHHSAFFAEGVARETRMLFGISITGSVYVSRDGHIFQYHDAQQLARARRGFRTAFSRPSVQRYIAKHMIGDMERLAAWMCTHGDYATMTDTRLLQILHGRHVLFRRVIAWQWVGFLGKLAVEELLRESVRGYKDAAHIMRTVIAHDHPVHIAAERATLEQLALSLRKRKASKALIDKAITAHLTAYGHVTLYDETYAPLRPADVRRRLFWLMRRPALQQQVDATAHLYARRRRAFARLLRDPATTPRQRNLWRFIHQYSMLVELRNFYRGMICSVSVPLYTRIADRFGLSLAQLLAYTDEEIAGALSGKIRLSAPEARRRIALGGFVYRAKGNLVVTGPRAAALERRVHTSTTENRLTGQVAYAGATIRGRVAIVHSTRDMPKLKHGDILVSSMTRPEFLMSIKRAAAIVTDEGGVMCHAAIIARELHKPCIVGTKHATQVFKDGDKVEVDAERGIVRKLPLSARSPAPKWCGANHGIVRKV
jgi:phosphohistidine swiveling domain-containing protein